MLQQILKDMYIAPELLAELDDEQKQTLFFKMRQEQIRRWEEQEKKLIGEKFVKTQKPRIGKPSKKVDFLTGKDNNPWTWVMGEHADDIPLEQLYSKYTDILESRIDKGFVNIIDENQNNYAHNSLSKTFSEPITKTQPVSEIKKLNLVTPEIKPPQSQAVNKNSLVYPKIGAKPNVNQIASTQDKLNDVAPDDVLRSSQNQRTTNRLQPTRKPSFEEVKAEGKEIFNHWVVQELKAKKLDGERRLVAKRIREDNARLARKLRTESQIIGSMTYMSVTDVIDIDNDGATFRPSKPGNMSDAVKWYLSEEKPKGALFDSETNQYSNIFHGTIDRTAVEELLSTEPDGTFLIRLSDKIWGYALSYKGAAKIRHYLIDAQHQGGYQFFGYNHPPHTTIDDFIELYKTKPLSVMLPEKLLRPCIRKQELILLDNL